MRKFFMLLLVVLCLSFANPCVAAETEKKEVAAVKVININTATAKELEMLPGIGKTIAAEIIQYRTENKFATPDDLLKVKGIGAKTMDKIRRMVVVK